MPRECPICGGILEDDGYDGENCTRCGRMYPAYDEDAHYDYTPRAEPEHPKEKEEK